MGIYEFLNDQHYCPLELNFCTQFEFFNSCPIPQCQIKNSQSKCQTICTLNYK